MIHVLFILFFSLLCHVHGDNLRLQEKFTQAQVGDYVVTAHDDAYSMLLLRSHTKDVLILEEVSIPSQQVDLKHINWRQWLAQKARPHFLDPL